MDNHSFSALWGSAQEMVGRHRHLLVPVAAALLFFPSILFSWANAHFPEGDSLGGVSVALAALNLIVTYLGQVLVLRILLGHQGRIGALLSSGLPLVAPLVAGVFIMSFGIGAGFVLLVLPGIYLAGRLSLTAPLIVDQRLSPIEALRRSWKAIGSEALRVGLMLTGIFVVLLVGLVFILSILSAFAGTTDAAARFPEAVWSVGEWVRQIVFGALATVASVYLNAFYVSLYRAFFRNAARKRSGG